MLKQTFLINTDLKMRKGKIAVQVAHGEVLYMNFVYDGFRNPKDEWKLHNNFTKWFDSGLMKKAVLKVTEKELHDFTYNLKNKNIWSHPVFDSGLTQIPRDSFTCLVIEPLPEEQCQQLFGHLKLL